MINSTSKKLFVFSTLALMTALPASAARINGAFIGCVTKNALDEFTTAAVNYDNQQMNALMGTACISINGLEYSPVDKGWLTSQIRVYGNGSSTLLWTVSEALR